MSQGLVVCSVDFTFPRKSIFEILHGACVYSPNSEAKVNLPSISRNKRTIVIPFEKVDQHIKKMNRSPERWGGG